MIKGYCGQRISTNETRNGRVGDQVKKHLYSHHFSVLKNPTQKNKPWIRYVRFIKPVKNSYIRKPLVWGIASQPIITNLDTSGNHNNIT